MSSKLPPLVKHALRDGSVLFVGSSDEDGNLARYSAGIGGLWASGRSAEAALDALEHAKEILQKHEPKHRRLPYGMCRSDCPACAYIGAATHCADALEGGGR